jgi:SEC-C motif-containing protein
MDQFLRKTRAYFEGATKLGRNDPSFCGSGKKFKKCCGASRH